MFRMGDRIVSSWVQTGGALQMLPFLDVLVLHFGLHYQDEVTMRREYESIMPKLDAFAAQPGKAVMLLEVGEQHFASSTGRYEDVNRLIKGCDCAPHNADDSTAVGATLFFIQTRLGPARVESAACATTRLVLLLLLLGIIVYFIFPQ